MKEENTEQSFFIWRVAVFEKIEFENLLEQ